MEYVHFGKRAEDDVINVGVYDGHRAIAYRSADDTRKWLNSRCPRVLFAWNIRAEFGSFACWKLLGVDEPTKAVDLETGQIQRFVILRDKGRTLVLDLYPFYKALGVGKLENAAKFLSEYYSDPSLTKVLPPPTAFGKAFGKRKPETTEEWEWYDERVRQDARITSVAAKFFYTELLPRFIPNPNPTRFYSWGTIARKFFRFPQINIRMGRDVIVKETHRMIHDYAEFAGRNEALSTGSIPSSYYADVASLYPISVTASDALRIVDVQPMTQSELAKITKPSDATPYGWLHGTFETGNDLWGLPVRSQDRNYYITGQITGLYHTLDLEASKARIVGLDYGLKPVFNLDRTLHDQYAKLTLQKIEGKYADTVEKHGIKQILNASLGSLGMYQPRPAATSNFPAYSTGLAMSHLIMSKTFDMLPKPIHYIDTDSAFIQTKRTGQMFTLTDQSGEWTMPVVLTDKGYGDAPRIFRSKHYYLSPDVFAIHAVQFEINDWLAIVQTLPDEATVTRQIRGTIRTRARKAAELQFGRWYYEKLEKKLPDLIASFHADDKRVRETYDSYGLCRENRWLPSRSLTAAEFYEVKLKSENQTATKLPSGQRYSVDFVKQWTREYGETEQTVPWLR